MFLLVVWFVMGVLCALVAAAKNRSVIGWFLLGCLFGPLALLFSAAMSPIKRNSPPRYAPSKKCSHCAEEIKLDAVVCKHCGRDVVKTPQEIAHEKAWEEKFNVPTKPTD